MPSSNLCRGACLSAVRPATTTTTTTPITATPMTQRRGLRSATMGFAEIAAWKAHRLKVSSPGYTPTSVFDIKVYTPIHKSNVWNISYPPHTPTSSVSPSSRGSKQTRTKKTALNSSLDIWSTPKAGLKPESSRPNSTLSVLAPILAAQYPWLRAAAEVVDVPSLNVLSRLLVSAQAPEHSRAHATQQTATEEEELDKYEQQKPLLALIREKIKKAFWGGVDDEDEDDSGSRRGGKGPSGGGRGGGQHAAQLSLSQSDASDRMTNREVRDTDNRYVLAHILRELPIFMGGGGSFLWRLP
ncbi:hypothetical protein QBC46DRAFT_432658 [Diplogelasinospora grovesii]|uniref:Uncharacterized protein n=1 Tax=Diplogelasinospora grovesii TaxID=303347 RepID=A0AAN6N8J8_9PEZI|nr:hypothetical protein QBC46DRAFT_432658 [Diplogelasinospora grovesii]